MRCAVYLRQSQDRTGDQLGVERQRVDVLGMVETRGWTVVETFIDNDTSATKRKPRPAFQRMLNAVDAGAVDVIAARHMDRLLRRLAELEDVLARCERRGVYIATASDGVDTSTDGGRLIARILSSVAQGEVERKSARQLSSNQQAAETGKRIGGRRAFGYESDGMAVRDAEAAALRDGYAGILAGVSLAEIARTWNTTGFSTPQGHHDGTPKPWTYNSVHQVLGNPRNAGLRRRTTAELVDGRRHNPTAGIVGQATWPAIVPEETWRAVVDVITHPSRRKGPRGAQRLLTGVARCGVCDAAMHGANTRTGSKAYRCSAKYCVTRRGDQIDDYINQLVIERLTRPDAQTVLDARGASADVGALRTEASALRLRLDALAVDFADGSLSAGQLRIANTRLREKLAAAESQLAVAGRPDVLGALIGVRDVAPAWEALSVDRRRAVIAELMVPHVLSPGRGARIFRADTVHIEWKVTER